VGVRGPQQLRPSEEESHTGAEVIGPTVAMANADQGEISVLQLLVDGGMEWRGAVCRCCRPFASKANRHRTQPVPLLAATTRACGAVGSCFREVANRGSTAPLTKDRVLMTSKASNEAHPNSAPDILTPLYRDALLWDRYKSGIVGVNSYNLLLPDSIVAVVVIMADCLQSQPSSCDQRKGRTKPIQHIQLDSSVLVSVSSGKGLRGIAAIKNKFIEEQMVERLRWTSGQMHAWSMETDQKIFVYCSTVLISYQMHTRAN